jgi:outer membrane lipoprotein carrier protein
MRARRAAGLWLVGFLGASAPAFAAPATPVPAIAAMQRRFEELTDLSADFERTLRWKLADRQATFRGRLVLKKPHSFRFESNGQVLSTDGRSVWNYARENRQVVVTRYASPEQDRSPEGQLFHLLFRGDYARDYVSREAGQERADGKTCQIVDLTSRREGAWIASVRLWIEAKSSLPLRVEYTDYNGDRTAYRLRGIRTDRKVSDEAFRFVPPAGVEVVDLR